MSATAAIIVAGRTAAGPSALAVALSMIAAIGDVVCEVDNDDPPCLIVFPAMKAPKWEDAEEDALNQTEADKEAAKRRIEVVEYDPNPPFC